MCLYAFKLSDRFDVVCEITNNMERRSVSLRRLSYLHHIDKKMNVKQAFIANVNIHSCVYLPTICDCSSCCCVNSSKDAAIHGSFRKLVESNSCYEQQNEIQKLLPRRSLAVHLRLATVMLTSACVATNRLAAAAAASAGKMRARQHHAIPLKQLVIRA